MVKIKNPFDGQSLRRIIFPTNTIFILFLLISQLLTFVLISCVCESGSFVLYSQIICCLLLFIKMAIYQYCQGEKITSICKVKDGEFAPLEGRVSRKCEAAKGGVGTLLKYGKIY